MNAEQLRRELRNKELECQLYIDALKKKEREPLDLESKVRKGTTQYVAATRENEKKYYEEQLQIKDNYYTKKVRRLRFIDKWKSLTLI
jgi:hypothetical protein